MQLQQLGITPVMSAPNGPGLPPQVWLDSLRRLWEQAPASYRTRWWADGGASRLASALASEPSLTTSAEGRRALMQLATALRTTAAGIFESTALRTAAVNISAFELADELAAKGDALTAVLQYVTGDTARALDTLAHVAQRLPYTATAAQAAYTWSLVAEARHDTTAWLTALTLRYLETGWPLAEKQATYARLTDLYPRYIAVHGAPPDVLPTSAALATLPRPAAPLALEPWLDRQFTFLFEQHVPVVPSPRNGKSTRLVVVEDITGVDCHGCWHGDRAMQPLLRRYRSDQVVTLAYHGHYTPIGSEADSTWERIDSWYPHYITPVGLMRMSDHQAAQIGRANLLLPGGDTLEGTGPWVNGRSTDRVGDRQATVPVEIGWYQHLVTRIDQELLQSPAAHLELTVEVRRDSVLVTVHVDSLRGQHQALALRLVLLQDTVWLRGQTVRRLYTNVVRATAYTDSLVLGIPIAPDRPSTTHYAFDLAAIQQTLLAGRVGYQRRFPDPRDWQLDRTRLVVVAFVQSLATGDVLQAVQAKVPYGTPAAVH